MPTIRIKEGQTVDQQLAVTNRNLQDISQTLHQLVQVETQRNTILQNIYAIMMQQRRG